jgi:hypothetical protein
MRRLSAPCGDVVRGKIYPFPKKRGRSYFVDPDAQYVDDYNDSGLHEESRHVHEVTLTSTTPPLVRRFRYDDRNWQL